MILDKKLCLERKARINKTDFADRIQEESNKNGKIKGYESSERDKKYDISFNNENYESNRNNKHYQSDYGR